MNPSSPVLFCTACEQPFVAAEFAAGVPPCPACPACHAALVDPHSEPCPTCSGPLTPDGFMCVRCGPITQEIGDGKARLKALSKSSFMGAWEASFFGKLFIRFSLGSFVLRVDLFPITLLGRMNPFCFGVT